MDAARLLGFAWVAVLVCGVAQATAANEPVRPNIVFIMADDLGKEWISAYGSEEIETPQIDRLAEGGMKFTSAYSMPQCTPTRLTLLTGQYPFRHGWVNHWDVPRWGCGVHFDTERNTSVASILREAGYATAAAGKWQIDDFRVKPDAMDQAGFDDWAMWTGYETDNPPSAERYWDPYIHTREGSRTYESAFGPDVFASFLIDFMQEHRDRPVFLYYPMVIPHTPFTTTPDAPEVTGRRARHKAMVRYIDDLVGRFATAVDEGGFDRPAILIFTADNGTTGLSATIRGEEVRGGKTKHNEITGTSMPFIVYGPGLVPEGVTTDAITDFTDLLPTFAELAGADLPEQSGHEPDGVSIAPLLLGETEESPRDWILSMGGHPAELRDGRVAPRKPYARRVIRGERWKLWVNDSREPYRLYDLANDPFERENLIESEDADAVAARERLMQVIRSLPEEDAAPRYRPNPPQPWDRHPEWMEQLAQ